MAGLLQKICAGLALAWALAGGAVAQDRAFSLSASADLVESGLVGFLAPRFGLKHSTRVIVVGPGEAAALSLGPAGTRPGERPVLTQGRQVYAISPVPEGNDHAQRFVDWIISDVGQGTIEAFAPDGVRLYSAAADLAIVEEVAEFEGDTALGETVALRSCGRCHVIGEANKMAGIGSTPSFPVLRSLADWQERFTGFFALNPHPAFTQIAEVTDAFDPSRPPPIVPLAITLDEMDALLAFVAQIEPADLGRPLQHQ